MLDHFEQRKQLDFGLDVQELQVDRNLPLEILHVVPAQPSPDPVDQQAQAVQRVEVGREVAGGGAGEEVGDGKVGEPGVGRVDEDLREAEGGGVEGPAAILSASGPWICLLLLNLF
jgi:hypothetical protein